MLLRLTGRLLPSGLPLQVTKAAIGLECTLVCGFSPQECARYIETYKRSVAQGVACWGTPAFVKLDNAD